MKKRLFLPKAITLLILVCLPISFLAASDRESGATVANTTSYLLTFNDQFDDLSNWTLFGDPQPQHVSSILGRDGVFDNNGDGTDMSGAISIETFGLTGGFTIESDVYLDFSDPDSCWVEAAIGIANPAYQAWGGYEAHIYFSIRGVGDDCTDTPESLRGHAYFYGSYITDSGSESFFPIEASPTQFLADAYVGGWYTLKIAVDASNAARFYLDDSLIYEGTQSIASSLMNSIRPLWLGSHSSGAAGKAYHDNITFVSNCDAPASPVLLSPVDGEILCNSQVTFLWSAVVGVSMYHIQVDDDSLFVTPSIDLQIGSSSTFISTSITDDCQPFYWRVRAFDNCGWGSWSARRSAAVCSMPAVATLSSPADGAVDVSQPLTLDWNDVDGITAYQVQVDTNITFPAAVRDTTTMESSWPVAELEGNTVHYWRVRAFNGCSSAAWSEIREFTTAVCNTPAAPTPISPADGATDLTQPITLDWNDVPTALSYQLQVDDDSGFVSPEIDVAEVSSEYEVSGFAASSTHYWRVRAYNGCGWGEFSEFFSFATCETAGIPTLLLPEDQDTISNSPAFFDWDDLAGATEYRLQIDGDSLFGTPDIDVTILATTPSQYGTYALSETTRYYWRLCAFNDCGWGEFSEARSCTTGMILSVEEIESGTVPSDFVVRQNYPNPFNPTTVIEFSLPAGAYTTVEVFDVIGRKVTTLAAQYMTAGHKRVRWNVIENAGSVVSSGVYFYRVRSGDFSITRKMLLLK